MFRSYRLLAGLVIVLTLTALLPLPSKADTVLVPDDSPNKQVQSNAQAVNIDGQWYSAVLEEIALSEYSASVAKDDHGYNRLQAPNRANNLRVWFDDDGVTLVPRKGEAKWSLKMSVRSWGMRKGPENPVNRKNGISQKNRVDYPRDDIAEWYVNEKRGLEQGIAIQKKPEGFGDELIVRVNAVGLDVQIGQDSQEITFSDHEGARLIFDGLHARDAEGEILSARFEKSGGGFAYVVGVSDAVFPITIDPWARSANLSWESDQTDGLLGASAGSAGDVNGDSFDDVIVGAHRFDNGQIDEGRAFVYYGSAGGLSLTPNWTAESDQANAVFGRFVSGAGDVNGDGFDDVLSAAIYYDNGETDEGVVYLYLGSASGLSPTPAWTFESNQAFAYLSSSLSSAGDVNNDGYSDVIIGDSAYNGGLGQVYVFYGSQSGLPATPSWIVEPSQSAASFGCAVAHSDVNGDGFDDVIIGSVSYDTTPFVNNGKAFVYYGGSTGLSDPVSPSWSYAADQSGAYFGSSVAGAGDVNGDGKEDIIIGSRLYDSGETDEGRAYIFHGAADGLQAAPARIIESNQASANFGVSVAGAGDVNGDGFSDVIVGSSNYDGTFTDEGRGYLYYGSAAGISSTPAIILESRQKDAYLGFIVSGAGDVNGDGFDDVIAGAYGYDHEYWGEGRISVYYGSANGLTSTSAWMALTDQSSAMYGYSLEGAGDVNHDGHDDVIIGAYLYDSGQVDEGKVFLYYGHAGGLVSTPAWTAESNQASAYFGKSLAGVGDVNGDTFDDIVVGAYLYDNGHTNEGAVFAYYGSAVGLPATPNWTAEGNQTSGVHGSSVAGAGDVNGDGWDDVIVGAYGYDNGEIDEGGAFVYHGSPSGLSLTPNWSAESNQEAAYYGQHVDGAGDVNGDGYDDVIIGAAYFDHEQVNEGAEFLYYGSSTGLLPFTFWIFEPNQDLAYAGCNGSGAGDLNGDGFADVVVSAHGYDVGSINEGRIYAFYGSQNGLSMTPSWTLSGTQAASDLGFSIDGAGDVNGDGYDDVIVSADRYDNGQTDEGRVYLFHGTAKGLLPYAEWYAEINVPSAKFGYVVAGAGDVNGDGLADVLVGAPYYDTIGRAFVYYGFTLDGPDSDNDGLSDLSETVNHLTNPLLADSDGDGLSDRDEIYLRGTNPNLVDTDGDGLSDGQEVTLGTNPNVSDTDGDGLNDGAEVNTRLTNPLLADSDADGLSDGMEVNTYLTNPLLADTDGDSLSDRDEIYLHGTNPNLADQDNDGLSDPQELSLGTNPGIPDTDGDGLLDGIEDANRNGVVDTGETSPLIADTDGDGLLDGVEDANRNGVVDTGETNPLIADNDGDGHIDGVDDLPLDPLEWIDTDHDGIGNNADLDDDGDGYEDYVENKLGTSPTIPTDHPLIKTIFTYSSKNEVMGSVGSILPN